MVAIHPNWQVVRHPANGEAYLIPTSVTTPEAIRKAAAQSPLEAQTAAFAKGLAVGLTKGMLWKGWSLP